MPAPKLADARSFLDAGRNRDALAQIEFVGDLTDVAGTEARLMAGHIARNLGAPRLGRNLHLRTWRSAPANQEAQAAGLWALLEARGGFSVWQRLRQLEIPDSKAAGNGAQQLWLLKARVAAGFRDFDLADQFWRRAEAINPAHPSVHVGRAILLECEDRFADALAAVHRALELRPRFPSAMRLAAHLLQLTDRDQESLALLLDGAAHLQDVPLLMELARLQSALEQYPETMATLDAIGQLSPLLEESLRSKLLGFRARLAWRIGDAAAAAAAARELGDAYSVQFAERIASAGPDRRRIQLNVPFVAQHKDTCAPATVAAISRYWNQPVGQFEMANEVCYGGTQEHHTREWAEKNGWVAVEFTVDWPSAVALLDRGLPFQLTTREVTSGHAQAVIGYDDVQRTFIIRDPNYRHALEYPSDTLLEQQKVSGPSGLVMVPESHRALLDGLELPDTGLRDLFHRFFQALDQHRRDDATFFVESMQSQAPDHPITLYAGLALAEYDADHSHALWWIERLLALFPNDYRLLARKLDNLRGSDMREDRLALLEELCHRQDAPQMFLLRYAEELREDARQFDEASYWARRAMRRNTEFGGLACLAGILWTRSPSVEALELYRFAACLNEKNEATARKYFHAARHLNQTDSALSFLTSRFERLGDRSALPSISLFVALDELGRRAEALGLLESALDRRPDDGYLRLFAAEEQIQAGRYAEAEYNLKAAEGKTSKAHASRIAAQLALSTNNLPRALELWREILDQEPFALDAHAEFARLLAEVEGLPSALKHLEQACARNPRHFGLCNLWLRWLEEEGPLAQEPVWRWLLELNPRDAATRRGWAHCLAGLNRWDEALREIDAAIEMDPTNPVGHTWRGAILKSQGNFTEAQEAYRKAAVLSVDYSPAMIGLLDACRTLFDRRLALQFLQAELERNLTYGDGVLAFRELAGRHLLPHEVLTGLKKIHSLRPDLWQTWAALISELSGQGKHDEALALANDAVEKHPLSAQLWHEVASLHQQRKDSTGEIAALEKALGLNPGDVRTMRRMAGALERAGQPDRARTQLEKTLLVYPRDPSARYMLATLNWKQERRNDALTQLKLALSNDPEFAPAWESLQAWSRTLKQPNLVLDTARSLSQERSSDPKAWLRMARLLWDEGNNAGAVQALEKAIELHPKHVEAHDVRAQMLAMEDRFEEALAACRPAAWTTLAPPELRARAAWVNERQGHRVQAIEAMDALLEEAPHMVWAWEALAGWLVAEGRDDDAKAVIDRFFKAVPNNTAPYLWAAGRYERLRNYPEATELLERALTIDSNCVEARLRLMEIQLVTNQFHAAADSAAALREQGFKDWALAGEAVLALLKRDVASASTRLHDLCAMPDADPAAVKMVGDRFQQANLLRAMKQPLEKLLLSREAHPDAGALWLLACRAKGGLPSLRKVLRMQTRGEAGKRALLEYIRHLGLRGRSAALPFSLAGNAWRRRKLKRIRTRCADALNHDPILWSEYAAALTHNRARSAAARWIENWRERKNPKPFGPPLFDVLCRLGRDQEALEMGPSTLRETSPESRARVALAIAWLHANHGNPESASALLANLKPEKSWEPVVSLIEGLVRVRQAPEAERKQVAREAFQQVRTRLTRSYLAGSEKFSLRWARQSARLLASEGAGLRARFWGANISRWPI